MSSEDFQKACRLGDIQSLKSILKQSPNLLHALDSKLGWSPLYRTIVCGHLQASTYLLQQGAQPNIRNRLGQTALHQAAQNNQLELLNLLLSHEANPNLQQNDGDTALHISVLKGNLEIVASLLKQGADPNIANQAFGKTPLHYAMEQGVPQIIQILVQANANPTLKDRSGRSPADLAQNFQQKNLLKINQEVKSPIAEVDIVLQKKINLFQQEYSRAESIFEPECEKASLTAFNSQQRVFSFGGNSKINSLYVWLESKNLECLFDPLYRNGFDDFSILVSQTKSEPLTQEMLKQIGITKPGHRARLLFLLEESEPVKENKGNKFLCWAKAEIQPGFVMRPGIQDWLRNLNLTYLLRNFQESGYDDLEQLILLMNSKYTLTDEILAQQMGIEKLGHRHRILVSLRKEASVRNKPVLNIEDEVNSTACECEVMQE